MFCSKMVTYVNQTYGDDHFAIYTNIKPLCCTPDINIMLYVNYAAIKNKTTVLATREVL